MLQDITDFPREGDLTSADMSSLRVLMLRLKRENETVRWSTKNWSVGAIDFLESTSWASPYQLSDVSLAVYTLAYY